MFNKNEEPWELRELRQGVMAHFNQLVDEEADPDFEPWVLEGILVFKEEDPVSMPEAWNGEGYRHLIVKKDGNFFWMILWSPDGHNPGIKRSPVLSQDEIQQIGIRRILEKLTILSLKKGLGDLTVQLYQLAKMHGAGHLVWSA